MTERLDAIARSLRDGGIACIPTESTYGLAASLERPDALAAIAELKRGRAGESPFPVIACSVEQARALASDWPVALADLAERHWPGPLTLVVPAAPGLPPFVVAPGGTVGVRVSSHPIARGIACALGGPISATSANPHGAPAATSIEEARAYFGDRISVYVDGGLCDQKLSTVVAPGDGGALRILRHGAVVLPSGS